MFAASTSYGILIHHRDQFRNHAAVTWPYDIQQYHMIQTRFSCLWSTPRWWVRVGPARYSALAQREPIAAQDFVAAVVTRWKKILLGIAVACRGVINATVNWRSNTSGSNPYWLIDGPHLGPVTSRSDILCGQRFSGLVVPARVYILCGQRFSGLVPARAFLGVTNADLAVCR